jgi:hypothetical protein
VAQLGEPGEIGEFDAPEFEASGLQVRKSRTSRSEKRWWIQVIVSGLVLAALLLIFTRKDDAEAQKWAFGTIGLILGILVEDITDRFV